MFQRLKYKTKKDRMRPVSGCKKVRSMRPVSRSNGAAVTPHFLLFQAQAFQSPDLDFIFYPPQISFSIKPHFLSHGPSPASQTRAVDLFLQFYLD